MKKTIKMFLSFALSLASISLSTNMLSVSATYEPREQWGVYYVYGAPSNTPGLYPSCHKEIYTYGGGYKTKCTSWDSNNHENAVVNVSTPHFDNYIHTDTGISEIHYYTGSSTITFTFVGQAPYGQCKASGTVGYYYE